MYVDRSRNVYTDASYADRERFSLSRRRVRGVYTGEKETERGGKKRKKCSVEHGQWFIVLSKRQWQCVGVFRISSLTKFVVQQWSGKLKKYLKRIKLSSISFFFSGSVLFHSHVLHNPCIFFYIFNKFFSISSSKYEKKSSLIFEYNINDRVSQATSYLSFNG